MNGAAPAGAPAGGGTAAFDAIAPTYDASRGGTARAAGFAGQLAPLLDPAAPVLDIGVGPGIVAAELATRGHRVYGVDLSPGMPLVTDACTRLRALPEPWRPRVREMADFVMVFRKA
ncbi:methyltransferase domain-containing protein [Streptomyces sp. SKN60]|uniref:class I SAM-dependent methyltransferase n=1 Tax=Streptomyces sp. SKN60 TaxID=2855506 RepID=UPI002246AE95|nr:class I SAM-dependent methyltransferase [Streptomyces sp. SKN60]MCX2180148.1 methyltransferase domain-containing protein [Streptomyces sp. SKN60]